MRTAKSASNSYPDRLMVGHVPIEQIVPSESNSRRHRKAKIKDLALNIERNQGLNNPLAVRTREDGRLDLIAGHARLAALKLNGAMSAPVIRLDHLSPAQARAYLIADNAFCERATWDRKILRGELEGLIEMGEDLELTGLRGFEIDSVLSFDDDLPGDAAFDDDESVELPDDTPPITRLGDRWICADQHLLCADARRLASFQALMGNLKARVCFTDPPFNTAARNISKTHSSFVMGSGELSDDAFVEELLRPSFRNIAEYALPGAIAFVCSDWRCLRAMWDAAKDVFVEPKNLITWGKSNSGMGAFYRQQTEYIIPFLIAQGHIISNFDLAGEGGRHRSTLWLYPGANTFRRGRQEDLDAHPTVKNRKMVADAIKDVSRAGDVVLDPFLGSGTTLAASFASGRRGYGLELDPKYCDVILRRLHKVTGEMPTLADGTPFDVVAAARAGGDA